MSGGTLTTETTSRPLSTFTTTTVVPVKSTGVATNHQAITGGIIGGILAILLAIGSCFFYRRRYRKRSINFVPYLNLDGDKPPRASIAHDPEAPPSPIFNPMAMVASSSRVTTPAQMSATSVVTKTPIPFHDFLNDEKMTIKRTASFSRLSRNSYPRSSFSSQITGTRSSRYSSSSSSTSSSASGSFVTADGVSFASTVKVGELVNPFADPEPSVLRTEDPFSDSFGLQKTSVFTASGGEHPRFLPLLPQLHPIKPSTSVEGTRISQASVESSHVSLLLCDELIVSLPRD
ncbi:hypothetical protein C8J55DRAFT_250388 [Lentinula edodes]|uniref:Uncharacterized protein n=1 Tax=Lentinula lateritia TaxID=40482 RepID=A0A9W9AYA7_9AGAR|nr:hypothetical protein C8J55DRAFT_250388 [Lentinula edodes]